MNLTKLYLAPMAGAADIAMRLMCFDHGADMCTTEMISAAAVKYGDKKTFRLAAIDEREGVCALQVFGHDPGVIAYAIKALYDNAKVKPAAFDINMGCPVKKVVSNGDGSALMRDPLLAANIMEAAVKASPVPVTVKMRLGWDREHINCAELCRIAGECGVSSVCVHGRTSRDMYAPGTVDINAIAEARAAARIPFTANGDITDVESAEKMLSATGADALMIGRAALGDPFVFEMIRAGLGGLPYTPPTVHERLSAAKRHLLLMVGLKGERTGVCEGRKHAAWYTKGMTGSAALRRRMNSASSTAEMINILEEIEKVQNYDGTTDPY